MPSDPQNPELVTAAMLVIGDEILSGRTQDTNVSYFATWLGDLGIQMKEVRVVADEEGAIADAINALRFGYTYVFTTGGIGPTHDDITADSLAKAFGVGIDFHPEAMKILDAHYAPGEFNEARKRMARIPDGASLIDNPVSKAPGFQIENVFVMAGIPAINRAMLESVRHKLVGGRKIESRSLRVNLPEGAIAKGLGEIQDSFPSIAIGSYPYHREGAFGVILVLRSDAIEDLERAFDSVFALVNELGGEAVAT